MTTAQFLEAYKEACKGSDIDTALYHLLKAYENKITGYLEEDETGYWLHKALRVTDVTDVNEIDAAIWNIIHQSKQFWPTIENLTQGNENHKLEALNLNHMREYNFSEGPWEIYHRGNKDANPGIKDKNGVTIIEFGWSGSDNGIQGQDRDQQMANVRLIKAAPKMYDLLLDILTQLELDGPRDHHLRILAKAKKLTQKIKA